MVADALVVEAAEATEATVEIAILIRLGAVHASVVAGRNAGPSTQGTGAGITDGPLGRAVLIGQATASQEYWLYQALVSLQIGAFPPQPPPSRQLQ